jgi:hypothetical protein
MIENTATYKLLIENENQQSAQRQSTGSPCIQGTVGGADAYLWSRKH